MEGGGSGRDDEAATWSTVVGKKATRAQTKKYGLCEVPIEGNLLSGRDKKRPIEQTERKKEAKTG